MGGTVQQLYGQPAVNSGMTDALNRMREAGITGSFTAGAALADEGLNERGKLNAQAAADQGAVQFSADEGMMHGRTAVSRLAARQDGGEAGLAGRMYRRHGRTAVGPACRRCRVGPCEP